jgi:hypothetical protein
MISSMGAVVLVSGAGDGVTSLKAWLEMEGAGVEGADGGGGGRTVVEGDSLANKTGFDVGT